jgi:hypothetical protein
MLRLRNVQAGALQDSATSWPPTLDLEGFHYDRLGGLRDTGADDMRNRSAEQWSDLLRRDPTFSTQPYVQLASVLTAAGHRDAAERIQYAGRDRERQVTCARSDRWQCVWLTSLWLVAGYGIGLYSFRVAYWVLGLTVLGALVLATSRNARACGWLWMFGASLHRLLPVIGLYKGFSNFFDNPAAAPGERRNLNRTQVAFFACLAIAGWVLGGFLIAALGGLFPKG